MCTRIKYRSTQPPLSERRGSLTWGCLCPKYIFALPRSPPTFSLSLLCSASSILSPLASVHSLLCSALCLPRWVHPRVALLQGWWWWEKKEWERESLTWGSPRMATAATAATAAVAKRIAKTGARARRESEPPARPTCPSIKVFRGPSAPTKRTEETRLGRARGGRDRCGGCRRGAHTAARCRKSLPLPQTRGSLRYFRNF